MIPSTSRALSKKNLLRCQWCCHHNQPNLRDNLIPKNQIHSSEEQYDHIPTASKLCKAGIRFKACEGNISVMRYDKKKLQIDLPKLVVEDDTEDVLRNLVAHEQTSSTRRSSGDFSTYAVIMDALIDTPEDLAILTKARVIDNHLGDDERLVKMWNKLCDTNIVIKSCERWDEMTRDVLEHYHSPWRPMYVEFYDTFFSRPWFTASLTTAILILILTFLQTFYTILGYY